MTSEEKLKAIEEKFGFEFPKKMREDLLNHSGEEVDTEINEIIYSHPYEPFGVRQQTYIFDQYPSIDEIYNENVDEHLYGLSVPEKAMSDDQALWDWIYDIWGYDKSEVSEDEAKLTEEFLRENIVLMNYGDIQLMMNTKKGYFFMFYSDGEEFYMERGIVAKSWEELTGRI